MSDGDALLRAIRAAPGDDAPRLIYADWLDEHGEGERAEFIRLQCRLADLEKRDDHPNRPVDLVKLAGYRSAIHRALKFWATFSDDTPHHDRNCEKCVCERIQELWDAGTNAGGFLEVPAHWGIPYWCRGFIDSTRLSAADCINVLDQICEQHPIREVRLTTWPQLEESRSGNSTRLIGRNKWHPLKTHVIANHNIQVREVGCAPGELANVAVTMPMTPKELCEAEWPGSTFHLPQIQDGDPVYLDALGRAMVMPWRRR